MPVNASSVDTNKVTDRRVLHFNCFAEMMADADRIAASERAGTLRRTGNWTTGQALGHIAAFVNYAYDGYPSQLDPPWIVRFVLRLMKKRFFRGPLPAGRRIPGIKEGTVGIEPLSLDEGLARFKKAIARLEKAPPTKPNIIFGPLTHEEWKTMPLRHSELHLSFLHPG